MSNIELVSQNGFDWQGIPVALMNCLNSTVNVFAYKPNDLELRSFSPGLPGV